MCHLVGIALASGRTAAADQVEGTGNPRSCTTQQWTDDARPKNHRRCSPSRSRKCSRRRIDGGHVSVRRAAVLVGLPIEGPGGTVRGPPRRARDRPLNGTLDRGSVLVDTNTIIEAYRTRAWAALAGGWARGNSRRLRDGDPNGIPAAAPGTIDCGRRAARVAGGRACCDRPGTRRVGLACAGHRVGLGRGVALGPCARAERPMGAVRSGQGQPAVRNPAWISGTARIPPGTAQWRGPSAEGCAEAALHKEMARRNARRIRSRGERPRRPHALKAHRRAGIGRLP